MKTIYLLIGFVLTIYITCHSSSNLKVDKVIFKKCSILIIYLDYKGNECQVKTYPNYKSKPIEKVIFYYKSDQDATPYAFKIFYNNDFSFYEGKILGYDITTTDINQKSSGSMFPGEIKFIHKISNTANIFTDEE